MKILTEKALLTCDHATGVVSNLPSQSLVRINGGHCLIGMDPALKPITGCSNISTTIKPCTSTLNVESGNSELVFINRIPVNMDTICGGTDGTPPGITKYRVKNPGQTLVTVEA